ncbi:hypothetical protein PRUPE_6G187400 [Prunus persica]|uniref:Uncharacterized protein n=1 Tax=Prunus persica TaxID=3760 RepID=A0A251NSJ5_PRUPE|nr:hypothetical protein PRUPE_6G187400 [Prunus persica]
MAVNASDEGSVDQSCSIPVSCSNFKLLKQTINEVDQHCSLDILPLLLEKAPLPAKLKCPFHSSHAPDVYSISMLPEEGNSLRCASVLGYLNFLKVYNSSKSQMCMDAQSSCQNGIDSQANMADSHPPCIIEIDLEKGCIQAPESEEEAIESLKREGLLTWVTTLSEGVSQTGKPKSRWETYASSIQPWHFKR